MIGVQRVVMVLNAHITFANLYFEVIYECHAQGGLLQHTKSKFGKNNELF